MTCCSSMEPVMSQFTFAPLSAEYRKRWSDMTANAADKARITNAAKLILKGRARYEAVSAATGTPWGVIGVWHYRESACDFRGVLHNGERILGTGRKTKLVPAGRGPFTTWEEAARDALALKGLRPGAPVWSPPSRAPRSAPTGPCAPCAAPCPGRPSPSPRGIRRCQGRRNAAWSRPAR